MIQKLKQLAQDTVVYGLSIFLGRFLTFLLTPFYTNYLPKEEFGVLSVFFTVFAFLNILYSFGFDSGYFRFAAEDAPQEEKNSIFTMTFLTILTISSLSTILLILFRYEIATLIPEIENGEEWVLIAAFIPLIDSLMFIPFSRLRLLRRTVRFGLTRFAIVVVTVVMNLWLVMGLGMDGKGVLIAGVVSPLVLGLTFIPDIFKNFTSKIDTRLWKQILWFSIPTVPASLAVIALQFIDQPLLKAYKSAEAVAVYNASYKLALPMMMFVSMFEYAWKPFYLNNYKADNAKAMFRTVLSYYVAFCGFIFLSVSGFIPYIVRMDIGDSHFYPESYWYGLYIIPIIMGGYFFNGLFNQFAMGVNITKSTKYLPMAVGVAAIFNLLGNMLLIPIYGMEAAAWLTLFSYAIAAIIIFNLSKKVYPIEYDWKKISVVVVLVLVLFFTMKISKGYLDTHIDALPAIVVLLLYPCLLYLFGFFSQKEISYLKRLFKRKSLNS